MCGSIPDIGHAHLFDRSPQRRSPHVQLSYSDIVRGHVPQGATKTQNSIPDDAIADTTIDNNLSCQDNTSISELSMVTGLSIMKKCMEEIDKQRDEFTIKKQIMDDSIISVTTSVSKLTKDILVV
jgi:hypothetical protein